VLSKVEHRIRSLHAFGEVPSPLSPRLYGLTSIHNATRDWHWVHVSYRRVAHSMAHPAHPLLTASSWPIRIVTFTGRTRHSAQTKFDFSPTLSFAPFLFHAFLCTHLACDFDDGSWQFNANLLAGVVRELAAQTKSSTSQRRMHRVHQLVRLQRQSILRCRWHQHCTSDVQQRGHCRSCPFFQTIPFLSSATVCPLCTATQAALQRAHWKWVTNSGQASETDYKRLMKEMELFGIAFSSLAIRSRCLDYIKVFSICLYNICIGLFVYILVANVSYAPDI